MSSLLIFPACRNELVSKEKISTTESTENLAQKTIDENSIKESERKPAEEAVEAEEIVEEAAIVVELRGNSVEIL